MCIRDRVTTDGGWEFSEAHVHADTEGDFPVTKKGSPKVGHFFHSRSYEPWETSDVFEFDLDGETSVDVAVHLSVWDTNSTDTVTFYSDGESDGGTTQVTSTNTGAVTPFTAVDAWEPDTALDDTTDSVWDSRVTYDFEYGDWIWEAERTVDPNATQSVDFGHGFEVPGPPAGQGTLHIANDNTYVASMNDAQIGSQPDWEQWPTAGSHLFDAVMGSNTLTVTASNYGDNSDYTIVNNPAGLIFEGSVDYYDSHESAWGDGSDFDGRDWSMKITYNVCGVVPSG